MLEIIMQTANVTDYTDIRGSSNSIMHDGVIPAEASLAKKLLVKLYIILFNSFFSRI